jgi:uncharacterized membrane protein YGL010W
MRFELFEGRTSSEWIQQYSESHQHPVNRFCHTIGIPLIAVSIPFFLLLIIAPRFWLLPVTLFIAGWLLQFTGHWFEGKPPEFFRDWRFLFVGLRWWSAKIRGRV